MLAEKDSVLVFGQKAYHLPHFHLHDLILVGTYHETEYNNKNIGGQYEQPSQSYVSGMTN